MTTQSNSMASPLAPQGIAPAALSETQPFYWSVRRELWENHSLYIAPLAVAAVYMVGFVISEVAPLDIGGLAALDPGNQRLTHHAVRPRGVAAPGDRSPCRDLLFARCATRRASRSQHPVLEVAAGFRSYDSALEGEHSSRGSAAAHLCHHRYF